MASLLMLVTDVLLKLIRIIYPVQEPNFRRDRPLGVLCLGPSRSGTDSLSQALLHLGYDDTYRGLQVVRHRFYDVPQWHRLGQAKMNGYKAFLCCEEFDKILGNCMALTDTPCSIFSEELIRCYPQAKCAEQEERPQGLGAEHPRHPHEDLRFMVDAFPELLQCRVVLA